jgi:hypothetical protein
LKISVKAADRSLEHEEWDRSTLDYTLSFDGCDLVAQIGNNVYGHRLSTLISALEWLCRAIRSPYQEPSPPEAVLSLSSCQILPLNGHRKSTAEEGPPLPEISLNFTLLSEPFLGLAQNCWQELFVTCFVLEDEESECVEAYGKGLELSFDLMITLAAVVYPIIVHGGVVLAGYQTVLIPTQVELTYVQFHLQVRDDGQINPFELDYGQRVQSTDWAQFKSMRCFLGWCSSAHIKLGTSSLPTTVTYSSARTKERTLHLNGVSAGFQLVSAAPIQAGVNGQASFTFLSHHLRFPPKSYYARMLLDTAKPHAAYGTCLGCGKQLTL